MRKVRMGELQNDEDVGTEVAELHPGNHRRASAAELVARRRTLPRVDAPTLRAEVASVVDETS